MGIILAVQLPASDDLIAILTQEAVYQHKLAHSPTNRLNWLLINFRNTRFVTQQCDVRLDRFPDKRLKRAVGQNSGERSPKSLQCGNAVTTAQNESAATKGRQTVKRDIKGVSLDEGACRAGGVDQRSGQSIVIAEHDKRNMQMPSANELSAEP